METCDSEQATYFKNLLFYVGVPSSSTWISNFLNKLSRFLSHVCVTLISSRILREENNTFYIDRKDQDKREIFKNLQERDNDYRNNVLSRSRAALLYFFVHKIFVRRTRDHSHTN